MTENARAREMRKSPTRAERRLWGLLRNRRLAGAKFRRQHPVGPYVLDFFCHELRLAVEADGESHEQGSREDYDARRTRYLNGCGIQVLRFTNEHVCGQADGVADRIREVVEQRRAGLRESAR